SAAWYINKIQETAKKKLEEKALEEDKETGAQAAAAEEVMTSAPKLDQIGLSLGYGLFGLVQENPGHNLLDQIKFLRRNLARELGFIMPSLRIRDAMQLPANQYVVYIKEIEAGRGELKPNMLLAMNFNGSVDIPGDKTVDPAFGQPAVWIDPMYREDAMFKGFTVAEPVAVIATHLIEIIKANMPDLQSFSETQKLLDELSKEQGKLVSDLVPSRISVGGVQRVLQNLLAEQVSIRDLPTVLEGIADGVAVSHNPDVITEHVRARLSRQISSAHSDENGIIHMVVMSPQWVQTFGESTVGSGDDKQAALSPTDVQKFVIDMRKVFAEAAQQGISAVLVTPPVMRLHVRRIVERMHAQITVLSQSEIHPKFKLKTVGSL
ncbi:MAG: FHIPEP family type III secretion protein, partial [Alphaproteobacteria bacterium]|nr:FHIPEP family type III secretion protein [Alphaproteobacteria bacterium]